LASLGPPLNAGVRWHMDWSREPLGDFFRYKVLRTPDGLVWVVSSVLCMPAGVWFWISSGHFRSGMLYLLWPLLSFLFYIFFEPLSRTRVRLLALAAVAVLCTLPLLQVALRAV
ncbi:MAG TPA: hypothetical protein VNJ47_01420, partial [Nevskiales bacterium]|nr:hypothetical protein [Nevskiales bacterium]